MGDCTLERGLYLSEGCLAEVGGRCLSARYDGLCESRSRLHARSLEDENAIEAMYSWLLVLTIRFGPYV